MLEHLQICRNFLLESYPEKLAEAEQRLETVQKQMANAKAEVGKPFPKEEELNQKLERLSELNALLNMDERKIQKQSSRNQKRKKKDRHEVLSMRNCRFIKKRASGKVKLARKPENGISV